MFKYRGQTQLYVKVFPAAHLEQTMGNTKTEIGVKCLSCHHCQSHTQFSDAGDGLQICSIAKNTWCV
jgi:hypothetical protein